MLAQQLREGAFGDCREVDVASLGRACAGVAAPRSRWLAGVVLGARGRYAAATTVLAELAHSRDALSASLALSALGAHRRQLGGHARALALDGRALAAAMAARDTPGPGVADPDGMDAEGARMDALTGLAADHLGLGRLSTARAVLAVVEPRSWRAEVRAGWVRAELELSCGRPVDAVPEAERAAATAKRHGAIRHAVKSDLVLAASLLATGESASAQRARGLAGSAGRDVAALGLASLSWPARLLLAELEPDQAARHRARVTDELHAVLRAADPQGKRLARESAWVPV